MKALQKISVGTLICFTALLTNLNFTSRAQTNNGVTSPPDAWFMLNPVFANNPAAKELVTNLLTEPQPELSVPEVSQTWSPPGTYWTLKNGGAPLPMDMFPDLPVYQIGTNQYLIDDRSVDYATLDAQMQAEAELEGLTNPPISINPINTNGLWLEVPPDSLADANYFKVILHNAIQGQSYDFLTTSSLNSPIAWATELTTNNPSGNSIEVELPMSDRPILFVRARVTESYSFYINTPPMSQDVYDGDSVTFYVNTGGNTNLTFQWTFDGVDIPGATNNSYTIDSVQDSDAGYYAVIISDGTNSLVTTAAQLTTEGSTGDANLIPVTSGRQNYTFKSGVTYYIGSQTYLYGNTTIEGGAIIKFDWNYNSSLLVMGGLTCKTEPYNPAILTTIDDDAVGELLGNSSGYPQTATNGTPYLDMTYAQSNSISNLRVCFADWGVTTPLASRKLDVWDCQFVECNYGLVNLVAGTGADDSLHNVLFAACGAAVGASSNSVAIEGEQVTADVGDFCLANATPGSIALTNSIVWGNTITASNLSTVNVAVNPDGTNFVYEGNGSYYLAANSPLHKAGTVNISSRLQTELQSKSTCSPIPIVAFTQISGNFALSPQAARYTNGAPDLGYYYDALDYSVASLIVSKGNLTVLPGTAIAVRNDYFPNGCPQGEGYYVNYTVEGIIVQQGSSIVSHGTPSKPNIFTAEKTVQEFPDTDFAEYEYYYSGVWFGSLSFVPDFEFDNNFSAAPTLDFRFSKFYLPPNDYHFWSGLDESGQIEMSSDSSMYLSLQDCQIHGGRINLGNPDYNNYDPSQVYAPGAVSLLNNSFENVSINLDPTYNEYGYGVNCDEQVLAYNNLFKGGLWLHLEPFTASAGNWIFTDNLFDHSDLVQDINEPLDYNYNGYWPLSADELTYDYNFYSWYVNNSNQLQTTTTGDGYTDGGNEVTLNSAPPYQFGTFGKFYLPDTTTLYGAGSRSPADAGLYHYTTRIDQTKEGDETSGHMVNIGVHYVAANIYGQPKDSDSDGIPDYAENWHGDGNYSIHTDTETDWQNPMTDGVNPDPSNSLYLNTDLSGDGLVGRVKAALGMNPLDAGNPLALKQVITGNEPDIATFEVPISYSVLTNIGNLNLYFNGVDVTLEDITNASDGNALLEWNTTYEPPGQHYLQAQLTLSSSGDDAAILSGIGTFTPFYSTNVMQFFESDTMFDDTGAYLDAQLPEPDANYTIQLYDPSTTPATLIKTITGSTSSGMIQENWDLTYDDGVTVFTNDTVNAVFNVTLLDPGSGTSTKVLHKLTSNEQGNGFDFVYVYTPTNSSLSYDFGNENGEIWNGMQAVVDTVLMPVTADGGHDDHYDSSFDNYTYEGNNTHGNGLSEGWPGYVNSSSTLTNNSSPTGLFASMKDGTTKNFYCYAHGSGTAIGNYSHSVTLFSSGVGDLLGNHYNAKGGLNTKNPYRFVFLDGCSTASQKDWRRAFGIFPLDTPNQAARNKVGPQAFVGWAADHTGWLNGVDASEASLDVATAYTQTLEDFYEQWMDNVPLNQCIYSASTSAENTAPFPVPQNKKVTISGINYEDFDSYNFTYTNVMTSPIYVVGHSGLKRSSLDSSQDNYYAAPTSTE
jgi:hypothetical protein